MNSQETVPTGIDAGSSIVKLAGIIGNSPAYKAKFRCAWVDI
jgi:hypothetical protein